MVIILRGQSDDPCHEIIHPRIHPHTPRIHPETPRESLAMAVSGWKNVSMTRSAQKTRGVGVDWVRSPNIFLLITYDFIRKSLKFSKIMQNWNILYRESYSNWTSWKISVVGTKYHELHLIDSYSASFWSWASPRYIFPTPQGTSCRFPPRNSRNTRCLCWNIQLE